MAVRHPAEVAPSAAARLAVRRAQLLQRSAELRERLAHHGAGLQPAFEAADGMRRAWRWLRAHPWLPALGLALLLARRPRRVLAWGMLAWRGWRAWRRLPPGWRGWLASRMSSASSSG
ncbi:MAG: YqjK family protein [Tepidimonas sp.]|uniref:YqjK family protein n=1 Tax=Tepidimonas sp. TaxID=2002775 RepID=UPI00298EE562|nr:YqjK family protein [Tepidimonas sp.]MCS6811808.1 YqjK-like family protein [Tepidimonas sp.]MDW8336440.1 YqjK family protein [Tepidimonas sp.]